MAKRFSASDLPQFRKQISALKKAGLLPKSVKVRTAVPSKIVAGKTLREYAKKYSSVAQGAAEVVQVSGSDAKKFKKLGYQTSGDKVIVPRSASEKVTVKNGVITVTETRNGIERIQLPVEYHNLEQYLDDAQKDRKEIQRMKRANERFSFKFFGAKSHMTFRDISHLLEHLRTYDSIISTLNKRNARQAREIYQNLEIVKIPSGRVTEYLADAGRGSLNGKKATAADRRKWPQWRKDQYKQTRAKEQRERRARRKKEKK